MSRQVTDQEKARKFITEFFEARKFITEFFESNPGASQHQCLKAMNNARFAPFPHLVTEVHQAVLRRRMTSMLVSPAKPETAGGPRPVIPAHRRTHPEKPMEEKTCTKCGKKLRRDNVAGVCGDPKACRARVAAEARADGHDSSIYDVKAPSESHAKPKAADCLSKLGREVSP